MRLWACNFVKKDSLPHTYSLTILFISIEKLHSDIVCSRMFVFVRNLQMIISHDKKCELETQWTETENLLQNMVHVCWKNIYIYIFRNLTKIFLGQSLCFHVSEIAKFSYSALNSATQKALVVWYRLVFMLERHFHLFTLL